MIFFGHQLIYVWQLASVTEGYSGADLELVCRESAMMPVRRMMRRIEDLDRLQTEEALRAVPDPPPAVSKIVGGAGSRGGRTATAVQTAQVATVGSSRPAVMLKATVQMAEVEALLKADPVTFEDVTCALSTTKPSSDGKITK
jgi:SpoVK/Ycf46/Vps4 family AAA+-type ATPase